jgi:6-pyruvoyl-tetrahydropterin synthase
MLKWRLGDSKGLRSILTPIDDVEKLLNIQASERRQSRSMDAQEVHAHSLEGDIVLRCIEDQSFEVLKASIKAHGKRWIIPIYIYNARRNTTFFFFVFSQIDVTFKIIIKFMLDHYLILMKWQF